MKGLDFKTYRQNKYVFVQIRNIVEYLSIYLEYKPTFQTLDRVGIFFNYKREIFGSETKKVVIRSVQFNKKKNARIPVSP
jgi:UDP-N-acetylenolpyruvoylglucosamine reductase